MGEVLNRWGCVCGAFLAPLPCGSSHYSRSLYRVQVGYLKSLKTSHSIGVSQTQKPGTLDGSADTTDTSIGESHRGTSESDRRDVRTRYGRASERRYTIDARRWREALARGAPHHRHVRARIPHDTPKPGWERAHAAIAHRPLDSSSECARYFKKLIHETWRTVYSCCCGRKGALLSMVLRIAVDCLPYLQNMF